MIIVEKFDTETQERKQGLIKAENLEPGIKDAYFVFEQTTPSLVWQVSHPLNKKPSVTVEDNNGNIVESLVEYIDDSLIEISHNLPIYGKAYLS